MSSLPMLNVNTISVKAEDENPEYKGFNSKAEKNVNFLAKKLIASSYTPPGTEEDDHSLELVRTLSDMSRIPGLNTFQGSVDSRLDPNNSEFDSKLWVKNFRKILDSDPEHFRHSSLGVAYRNLRARGIASNSDFQKTVFNYPYKLFSEFFTNHITEGNNSKYFDILKPMDGLIKPGTLTVVLGRPGAGCSTFLKSVSSHTYGFKIDENSKISYDGLTAKDIENHYRGEVTYSAELDHHFPNLTVGQTLLFAATLRTPQNRIPGVSREQYAEHIRDVYMATYGLLHTKDTKVGNDFVRGVSGGERKRVSIAEVSLCGSKIQCWDNATRGLDAATALEFVRALKTSAVVLDTTQLIAIYQCSQDTYNLFDNVIVLYEGYQIYFGPGTKAKSYFENMGYECPSRQTTADFLTSITSPSERTVRKECFAPVPKTPKEFSDYWKNSKEHQELTSEIDKYLEKCENKENCQEFCASRVAQKSKRSRKSSSHTLSFDMQIKEVCRREYWRIMSDPTVTILIVGVNIIMGLLLSSLFFNLHPDTNSFYYRASSMFFAILVNAFGSILELITMFEAKLIVEKHKKYALYRPAADAIASLIVSLPAKLVTSIGFNVIYYFMLNYRREPGRFFFYWLCSLLSQFSCSHIFRVVGCFFSTLSESMTPTAIILMGLVMYTGFVIPTPTMPGWSRWINYIDPIAYTFESLLTNEFDGRRFECSSYIPNYKDVPLDYRSCNAISAIPGYDYINGTDYIFVAYGYSNANRWRNIGIAFAFTFFFLAVYLSIVEFSKEAAGKGEVIIFQRSTLRKLKKEMKLMNYAAQKDIENGLNNEKPAGILIDSENNKEDNYNMDGLEGGNEIFHWRNVCYDIQIKKETRRILDHVDGWVKPGTLTALMGASGAGKTTLLDVLANRVTMGVVYGSILVNGRLRSTSFQRSTGYAQQQDIHLQTSTVREALKFSAYLRRDENISKEEKDEYVEKVINTLEMNSYADAIVGISGEGLNVEQRKRLTIGVELVAKPQLLLFLDEPTSGLDSQTSWSVCQLMRKLANNGQAILCTIHQPSARLLQEFDRMLLLQRDGQTVYFGDLGRNCQHMIDYFERYGASPCPAEANPAEWMLDVIGAAPGSHAEKDYHKVWLESPERQIVLQTLNEMEKELVKLPVSELPHADNEFASSYFTQYLVVTKHALQQYYRTPSYIWSKLLLLVLTSLFNGFTFFNSGTSQQGLQNQMLAVFMFTVNCNSLQSQYLPNYMYQRDIYEVRERPSKTFHWSAFILAQITAEIPWNIFAGTLGFFCWYYPVGLYKNAIASDTVALRGAYTWLSIIGLTIYGCTLGQLCIAGADTMDNAANMASMFFSFSLNFCGVLKYPTGFWQFMYRCSPFTYWIGGILSAALKDTNVVCSSSEFVDVVSPSGVTCGEYMEEYISDTGGYLLNSDAVNHCKFCPISDTNKFLLGFHINPDHMWINWVIFICFIFINMIGTVLFYWLGRVPKGDKKVLERTDQDSTSIISETVSNGESLNVSQDMKLSKRISFFDILKSKK